MTAATQNVEECLRSETARLMLANSEFLLLFNQAATDRAELAKLLHISDTQLGYITNAEPGHGLLRIGGSLVPFSNTIPRDTELYRLLSTTPGKSKMASKNESHRETRIAGPLTLGSLFDGIGVFPLAASRHGSSPLGQRD